MCISLVGGHDRMHREYKNIGSKFGHKIKVFTQMERKMGKSITGSDLIILFTNTTSHKMVISAVKESKKNKIPIVRCHSSSATALEETLKCLTQ